MSTIGTSTNAADTSVSEPSTRVAKQQAAASTVEAVVFALRDSGIAALNNEFTRRRLSELSSQQMMQVIKRLEKLQPKYPAITEKLISFLKDITP